MARFFGIRPAFFLGPALLMALFGDFTLASEKDSKARQKRSPTDYSSGSGSPPYSGSGSGYPPYSGSGSSGYPPYSGSSGYPPYSGSGGGGGCECKPRPDNCKPGDKPFKSGQPACTCTPDNHPAQCTLQPCTPADNVAPPGNTYECICNGGNTNRGKCYAPSQTIFTTGSMDVLGLATLFGIKQEADNQLAANILGLPLGDMENSQLSVKALDTLLGGASPQSSPLSGLLGGGLLPARK